MGLQSWTWLSDWAEKAMAPYSSTLAWRIPRMGEPGRLQSMGWIRVGRNWATSLSLFTFTHWRRKWQPTPVFLPGESQHRVGHDRSDLAAAVGKGVECEWVWLENQDGLPGGGGPGSWMEVREWPCCVSKGRKKGLSLAWVWGHKSGWGSDDCAKNLSVGDFPGGGPVAKTSCSQCRRPGFDPWSGY